MTALVEGFDTVLFDLDGVIYRGRHALPGVAETVHELARRGVTCTYVTNNAARSAATVADHLRDLGISCEDAHVVTSPEAAADILVGFLSPGSRVFVVGGTGIDDALRMVGLLPTRERGDDPAAVVQGIGPDITWGDLADAAYLIEAGRPWVATNVDLTLPTEHGVAPGNGSLVAAVANAVGHGPDHVAGKPEPALLRTALQRTGARRALMVGDRLDTDALGAHRVGIPCLFVASGVHSLLDVCEAPPDQRPTFLGADVTALVLPAPDPREAGVRRDGQLLHWSDALPSARAWDVATGIAEGVWEARDRGDSVDVPDAVRRWAAQFPAASAHPANP